MHPLTLFHTVLRQQIYLLNFLRHAAKSTFFLSKQNALYFKLLHFLVHKIFRFYIKAALKFHCRAPKPDG